MIVVGAIAGVGCLVALWVVLDFFAHGLTPSEHLCQESIEDESAETVYWCDLPRGHEGEHADRTAPTGVVTW